MSSHLAMTQMYSLDDLQNDTKSVSVGMQGRANISGGSRSSSSSEPGPPVFWFWVYSAISGGFIAYCIWRKNHRKNTSVLPSRLWQGKLWVPSVPPVCRVAMAAEKSSGELKLYQPVKHYFFSWIIGFHFSLLLCVQAFAIKKKGIKEIYTARACRNQAAKLMVRSIPGSGLQLVGEDFQNVSQYVRHIANDYKTQCSQWLIWGYCHLLCRTAKVLGRWSHQANNI